MDDLSGGPTSGPTLRPPADYPVLSCVRSLVAELEGVAGCSPTYLSLEDKRELLLDLERGGAMLASLQIRVITAAGDVAAEDGCRNVSSWVAPRTRSDRVVRARHEFLPNGDVRFHRRR